MNKKKIILIIIAFLLVFLWWYFTHSRDYDTWRDNVCLNRESVCVVEYSYSRKKFFGLRHVFTWGGGDPQLNMKVNIDGEVISWKGIYIPILINKHSNIIYMVVYDKETDWDNPIFRLYKLTQGSWIEINHSEFPKVIAIQNMWLFLASTSHKYARANLINDYSPYDVTIFSKEFNRSLNSKLWYFLETGKFSDKEPDMEFIRDFNDRYIRP